MDFNYSEEQEAVRQLAGQIFGERSTHERLKQIEAAAGDDGPVRPRPLAGAGRRRPARHPPGRGRRGCRDSTSWRPAWSWRRPAGRRPTCRWSRRWSTARCHRPLRHRRAAQDLADRGGQRRDDPHRRHGRAGRRGDPAWRDRAGHHGDGAGRTARGCSRAPRPASRPPSWPTPSWCRPRAGPPDGAATGVGVFVVDTGCRRPHHDAADDDDGAARGDRGARRRRASARTGSLGEGADGAAVIDCITEFATTALCIEEAGVCAVGAGAHRRVHQDAGAVRQADRHLPGRRAARRGRLRRHRGDQAHGVAGRGAPGRRACRRRPRWRSPSTGPPREASVSCTRRRTSTAVWASTAIPAAPLLPPDPLSPTRAPISPR